LKIIDIIWNEDRFEHIAVHKLEPYEVEEVCFGQSLVLRAKTKGENPVYYILGQTKSGRYLFCVIILFPNGKALSDNSPGYDSKRKTTI
jgi:hypothetical protein